MEMAKPKKVNPNMFEGLQQASTDAFLHGHYLQSAIIMFQTVETLLRILVLATAQSRGIMEEVVVETLQTEKSFYKLVFYLNLIDPDNILIPRLYAFNNTRNNVMHGLFDEFEDIKEYEGTLKTFCQEGMKLNNDLLNMMGVDT